MKQPLTKEQREEITRELQKCIWFTPKEALTWALAAFYGACKDIRPPAGEPWRDGPEDSVWGHGGHFVDAFHRRLTRRLSWEAEQLNLPGSGSACELLQWSEEHLCDPIFVGLGRIKPPAENDDFAALQQHELPPCSEQGATLASEGVDSAA